MLEKGPHIELYSLLFNYYPVQTLRFPLGAGLGAKKWKHKTNFFFILYLEHTNVAGSIKYPVFIEKIYHYERGGLG